MILLDASLREMKPFQLHWFLFDEAVFGISARAWLGRPSQLLWRGAGVSSRFSGLPNRSFGGIFSHEDDGPFLGPVAETDGGFKRRSLARAP
jgi:hypothetical protein